MPGGVALCVCGGVGCGRSPTHARSLGLEREPHLSSLALQHSHTLSLPRMETGHKYGMSGLSRPGGLPSGIVPERGCFQDLPEVVPWHEGFLLLQLSCGFSQQDHPW